MKPTLLATPPRPASDSQQSNEEFVYAVSHDLRGPLLNLQGFLRKLAKASDAFSAQAGQWDLTEAQRQAWSQFWTGQVQHPLDVLLQNARRLERLLSALLDYSRAGREACQFEMVSTMEIARSVAQEFRPLADERKASLRIQSPPDLWADPARVREILRRLLSNALLFLSPQQPGEVTLGGAIAGQEAFCWVQDNGIGLRPEDQARIFQPFGKIREIEAPGEGVGLAIVRKLAEQQGARVWVESRHGEGSTFYVGFPSAR